MSDLWMSGAGVAVSQAADRDHWLWAGGTVFDVILGCEHTGGSLALLDQRGRQGGATVVGLPPGSPALVGTPAPGAQRPSGAGPAEPTAGH